MFCRNPIRTMLHLAYRLSSSWELVVRECDYLKGMFFKLGYPDRLVDAPVTSFLNSVCGEKDQVQKNNAMSEGNIVRVILPFKDQRSADFVSQRISARALKCSKQILSRELSPIVCSTSVCHG